jgi:two-component system sensor histidine kinase/response regulator
MNSMVLIVDNRNEKLITLRQFLEHHGYHVDTADSGNECLKKAFKYDYYLILLNINMPAMEGFEVAEALSQYSRTENIPILFLSSFKLSKEQLLHCLDRSAWDFMEKPIDHDILIRKVRNSVRLYHNTIELKATQQALIDEIENRRLAEEKRGDFISVVCHELKTPLTSVKGYIQIAMLNCEEANLTPIAGMLKRADTQALKLTRLIDDLLISSRANQINLQYRYEVFPVNDFLNRGIESIGHSYPGREITLSGELNGFVFGDKIRLEQVLLNLLGNALKYSQPNTKVQVLFDNPENNKFRVQVKDFGVGIPKENQSDIFKKFFRVNEKAANIIPGLGLGLFISMEIIKHHDGVLGFTSEEGKGSTFFFTLPAYSK